MRKQHFHADTFVELPTFKFKGGDDAEASGTDEQLLSNKPALIRCKET